MSDQTIQFRADLAAWFPDQAAVKDPVEEGGLDGELYFGIAPDDQKARVWGVWRVLDDESHHHQKGKAEVESPQLVLELFGDDPLEVVTAAGHLDGLLDAYRGNIGGTPIRRIRRLSIQDNPTHRRDGSGLPRHEARLDFLVWYATP